MANLTSIIQKVTGAGRAGKSVAGGAAAGTGAKVAGDIVGDTIEGALEGAGSAIGGALQGAGAALGGALQGLGSAIGGALQGALTEGDKTIVNMGIVGTAAQQKVQRKVATPPPGSERSAGTPNVNENMPTKQLLTVVIKYLASIDNTLKSQLDFERQMARNEAAATREQEIEGGLTSSSFSGIGSSLNIKEKRGNLLDSNKVTQLAKTFGTLALGAGIFGIIGMNERQFERLRDNIAEFKQTFSWMEYLPEILGVIATIGGVKLAGKLGRRFFTRGRTPAPTPTPMTPPTATAPGAPTGGGMLVNGQYGSLRNGQNIGVGGTPFPTTQTGTRAMSSLTRAEIRSLGQQGIVPRGIGYYDTQTNRMLSAPQVFERVANAGRRMADLTPAQARLLRQAGYVGERGGNFWTKNGKPVTKEALFRDLASLEKIQSRGLLPKFLRFLKGARGAFLFSLGIDAALMAFGEQEVSARNIIGSITGAAGGVAAAALAGAAVGSIVPGLGTVVGGLVAGGAALVAGFFGYNIARTAGETAYDAVTGAPAGDREQAPPATPAGQRQQGNYTNYPTSGSFRKDAVVTRVLDAGPGFTVVQYQDGSIEKRGGNRASRNNNPGNISYGPFARSQGAVGTDGRFAVFPTPNAGFQAMKGLLRSQGYSNLTIAQAIAKWAPPSENDTQGYIAGIASLGIDTNKTFEQLTPYEQDLLVTGMAKKEGYYAAGGGPEMAGGSTMSQIAAFTAEAVGTVFRGMRDVISTDTSFQSSPGLVNTERNADISKNVTSTAAEKATRIASAQIENEANEVMGNRELRDASRGRASVESSRSSAIESAVRTASGGVIDVINPNYKMDPGAILNSYINFFGVGPSQSQLGAGVSMT